MQNILPVTSDLSPKGIERSLNGLGTKYLPIKKKVLIFASKMCSNAHNITIFYTQYVIKHPFYHDFRTQDVVSPILSLFSKSILDLMSLVFLLSYLRCLDLLKLACLPSSTLLRLCDLLYYLARKFQIITAHTIRTRVTEI